MPFDISIRRNRPRKPPIPPDVSHCGEPCRVVEPDGTETALADFAAYMAEPFDRWPVGSRCVRADGVVLAVVVPNSFAVRGSDDCPTYGDKLLSPRWGGLVSLACDAAPKMRIA